MNRFRRWVPRPLFSLLLAILWLLMVNSVSLAQILMGLALGLVIPYLTRNFWPEQARVHHLLPLMRYFLVLLADIAVSNLVVARRILWKPHRLQPGFFVYPLALEDDFAVTILASTISLTPGTVSAHYDSERRTLLIHALHLDDESGMIRQIRERYEQPLEEIFR